MRRRPCLIAPPMLFGSACTEQRSGCLGDSGSSNPSTAILFLSTSTWRHRNESRPRHSPSRFRSGPSHGNSRRRIARVRADLGADRQGRNRSGSAVAAHPSHRPDRLVRPRGRNPSARWGALADGGFPRRSFSCGHLRSLAQIAGAQPSTVPADNQWLEQKVQVSFNALILTVGSTSTPNASATVNATINEWSNTRSTTCTQSTFSAAQFASLANQQAWLAAGLLVNPVSPSVSCTTVSGPQSSAVGGGTGAFDISSLPTDPTTLAQELEAGTTGIKGLDQLPSSETGANPGFGRAVALLVGPTVGGSPQFRSALLNAMATMKGVSALGTVSTHSASSGLGFTAQAGLTQVTIVLSPSTGTLLEARNFQDVALQASGSTLRGR